ncbi:hypothetical protein FB45DRAFT_879365 [Roridomyces roridus]|uniref:Uncharacterized protein n=1 Tax=Roridomyces roridus TaxID=1738132 RepID=A0AAD7F6S7_9AGAR|nr:hypothetical protein FB45DRAFT_879365 [Roridomyces roridus]
MSTSSSPAKTQATKKLTIEWTPPVGPVGAPSRSFFDFFRGSDCVGSANYVLRVAHKEEEVGSKIWCQSVLEKITPFVRTALNSWESPKAVSGSTFLFFRGLKRVYQGSGKSDPDYESFPWPPSSSASFAKIYQLETDHKSPHTLLSTAKAPSFKTIFQGRAPPSSAKPSPVKPLSKRKPDDSVSEEEEDDGSVAGSVTPPPVGKKGSGKPASKKRRANVEVEDDHSEEEEGPSFAVVVPPRPKSSRSGAKSRRPSSTIHDQQLDIVPEDQPLTWKTMNNDQKVEHLTTQLRKLAKKVIMERDTWHVTSVPGSIPGYVLSLSFTRANGNTKLRLYDHMHESSAQAKSAAPESTIPEPLIPHTATDEAGGMLSTSVPPNSCLTCALRAAEPCEPAAYGQPCHNCNRLKITMICDHALSPERIRKLMWASESYRALLFPSEPPINLSRISRLVAQIQSSEETSRLIREDLLNEFRDMFRRFRSLMDHAGGAAFETFFEQVQGKDDDEMLMFPALHGINTLIHNFNDVVSKSTRPPEADELSSLLNALRLDVAQVGQLRASLVAKPVEEADGSIPAGNDGGAPGGDSSQ